MPFANQEGLPAHWGIETIASLAKTITVNLIRKDYPLIGVLKHAHLVGVSVHALSFIRKDYPLIGVLKRDGRFIKVAETFENQEGLPDYWGIETILDRADHCRNRQTSGRITRLLGY